MNKNFVKREGQEIYFLWVRFQTNLNQLREENVSKICDPIK